MAQLPDYLNFSMVAEPFGRTHAWLQGEGSEPRHEYGEGLSFSRFSYHSLRVVVKPSRYSSSNKATIINGGGRSSLGNASANDVEVSCSVSNIGRDGSGWTAPTDEVF